MYRYHSPVPGQRAPGLDNNRDLVIIHPHPYIGEVIEESDSFELWRALPIIYETLAASPRCDPDTVVDKVKLSGVYMDDLDLMMEHNLHVDVCKMMETIGDVSHIQALLNTHYVYEAYVMDAHSVALSFRQNPIEPDYYQGYPNASHGLNS